jgi:hypothetical protein
MPYRPKRSKVGSHLRELARQYGYPSRRGRAATFHENTPPSIQTRMKTCAKIAMRHNSNTASVPKPAAIASGCITGAFEYKDAPIKRRTRALAHLRFPLRRDTNMLSVDPAGSGHEDIA